MLKSILLCAALAMAGLSQAGSLAVTASGTSASLPLTGTGSPAIYVFAPTIAADTQNYNVRSAAISAGWNQVVPLQATITINAGVYVGASSTANYSFDTGNGYPSGSTFAVVNNGYIAGTGGAGGAAGVAGATGGPAFIARVPVSVTNNGTIGGGGGGGGGGSYGMGGGGQGFVGGAGYQAGTKTAPGAGQVFSSGRGSAGGALGLTGVAGGTDEGQAAAGSAPYGKSGGAAGAAVTGNANITWVSTGSRLGAINN